MWGMEVFQVNPKYKKDLPTLRRSIDAIDSQIILLLIQRFNISKRIAQVKSETSMPTEDLSREDVILRNCAQTATSLGASDEEVMAVIDLMKAVISESKGLQDRYRKNAD